MYLANNELTLESFQIASDNLALVPDETMKSTSKNVHEYRLIQKLIRGDTCAFNETFFNYNEKVYAFALKNLKNQQDAEGVVQEVFYNLWEERSKLKDVQSLNAWIFAICFNIIRKRFRQLARERFHLQKFAEISLSNDFANNNEIEYSELSIKVDSIIKKLPVRQREVFTLSRKEGLSNTEISKELNISKKTVENHLTKVKSLLKKQLLKERFI